jgi:hypothetical protein
MERNLKRYSLFLVTVRISNISQVSLVIYRGCIPGNHCIHWKCSE